MKLEDNELEMLGNMSALELIDRLNQGEIIRCHMCGKGKYVAPEGVLDYSHSFNCYICNNFLHITPGFTVE